MCGVLFPRRLILGVVFCLLGAIGGCESQPITETQRSINTVAIAQKNVADTSYDVGKTLTALSQYCDKPGRSTFQQFVKYSQAVQQHGRDLQDIAAVLADQGDTFFAKWNREISAMTNPQLKARAAAQKDSALKTFRQIEAEGPVLRDAYQTFVSDLNNLQTFFDYDKSPQGVGAAAPLIEQTREHGGDLQHQLDLQAANIARVKDIFTAMDRR